MEQWNDGPKKKNQEYWKTKKGNIGILEGLKDSETE